MRKSYRKKSGAFVTAVQLDLETDGFSYHKWGGTQRCKRGDWLVNNAGEVYTVDEQSFAKTYSFKSPGVYIKDSVVWAEVAEEAGAVSTKEGASKYVAGDYIVSNDEAGLDSYAITKAVFEAQYEPIDEM